MTAVPSSAAPVSQGAAANVLRMTGVSFARNGENILSDVSLNVDQGDFLAILGPNGGGKTTLLRIMLGLLRPDAGEVRAFGRDPRDVRSRIGYVPQFSTMRQDFPATVLDMTLMGAAESGHPGFFRRQDLWPVDAAARRRAMAILDQIGIADLAANAVSALSGGQRQRMLVARALMGRPENQPFLLLLDEPTASIDPHGKWCFFEFLGELRREITIVVVSHELGIASPFFSRVALVNKTLTLLPQGCPDSDILQAFIGVHAPDCPVGQLFRHPDGCRHPAAPRPATGKESA